MKYYSYENIDSLNAVYNIIYGQRSNGKTYGICKKIITSYFTEGIPSAYIRRLEEQIKPTYLSALFRPHRKLINKLSEGRYNDIVYRSHAFYAVHYDENGKKDAADPEPFCRTYSINTAETSKGQDAGRVKYIVFDEFMTRTFYLTNEFVLFQNLLSSIIRNHEGVTIYMLANTVNKHCPYFKEMGIGRIKQQKQGTIDVYTVGKSGTTIAVEYCEQTDVSPEIRQYYAFDNPEIDMIHKGTWEIPMYRHPPKHSGDYPVKLSFFIIFDENTIQGDIVIYESYPIIIFHPKTTELKNLKRSIVYTEDTIDGNPLHQSEVLAAPTKAHKLILQLISDKKTFFSDNDTGENVANWLKAKTGSRLKP